MCNCNVDSFGIGRPSQLIVGTEMKQIMILHQNGSEFVAKVLEINATDPFSEASMKLQLRFRRRDYLTRSIFYTFSHETKL
jgi:hypothetical protein